MEKGVRATYQDDDDEEEIQPRHYFFKNHTVNDITSNRGFWEIHPFVLDIIEVVCYNATQSDRLSETSKTWLQISSFR